MAQQRRSHVPKFGNWDTENVPYTTYFENARNEKGARMINPNDPQENPSAFFSHKAPPPPPPRPRSKEEEGYSSWSMQKISLSEERSVSRRSSTTTESGGDFSSSDMSLKNNHHRVRSRDKRSLGGSSMYSFPPPSPSRVKGGNHKPGDSHTHKVASVPKFGSWDETDPRSGEGFTIIFNKVKQEKQIGSTKFPRAAAPAELNISSNHQKQTSSPETKVCCCFFLRSKK